MWLSVINFDDEHLWKWWQSLVGWVWNSPTIEMVPVVKFWGEESVATQSVWFYCIPTRPFDPLAQSTVTILQPGLPRHKAPTSGEIIDSSHSNYISNWFLIHPLPLNSIQLNVFFNFFSASVGRANTSLADSAFCSYHLLICTSKKLKQIFVRQLFPLGGRFEHARNWWASRRRTKCHLRHAPQSVPLSGMRWGGNLVKKLTV